MILSSNVGKKLVFVYYMKPAEKQLLNLPVLLFTIIMILIIPFVSFLLTINWLSIFIILPTLLAMVYDKSNQKSLFLSVGLFNIAGIILQCMQTSVWHTFQAVLSIEAIKTYYILSVIGFLLHVAGLYLFKTFNSQVFRVKRFSAKSKINLLKQSWEINSY